MKDFNKFLTILIPTKNRYYFLKRQLTFYYEVGFSGFIFIGDSSNQKVSEQIQKLCNSYSDKLKTKYFYCPNLNEANTTKKLVSNIKTLYGVWVGDDDFLMPLGLNKCVSFLEKNKKFHAANGKAIGTTNNVRNPKELILFKYFQPSFLGINGKQRLHKYLKKRGDVHYSVHRINSLKKMYKSANRIKEHMLVAGEMPCLISVIIGNIKSLPITTLVRGIHDQRYNPGSLINRIKQPIWSNSLIELHKVIHKEFINCGASNNKNSREFIDYILHKKIFNSYEGFLNKNWNSLVLRYFKVIYYIKTYFGLWDKEIEKAIDLCK